MIITSTIISQIVVAILFFCFSLHSNAQNIQLSESVIGTYSSFNTDTRSYQSLTGSIPVKSFSNNGFLKLSVLSSAALTVSVSDPIQDLAPMVYPNPANGFLYIERQTNSQIYNLEIFSIYGSFLSSRQITGGLIDISGLSSGAYIFLLKDQNGNTWQYRILKI